MVKDVFTFIVGGKAGEGVKKSGSLASELFISMGRHVFQMDDYMSLIRGGHNFSVISAATRWVSSHYDKAELIINSDERSYNNHKEKLVNNGVLIYNSDKQENAEGIGVPFSSKAKNYSAKDVMFSVGAFAILVSSIGESLNTMTNIIKKSFPEQYWEDNISYATEIYEIVNPQIGSHFKLEKGDIERKILTGNELIALGAIAGGLDIYYGYPMTPASSILHYLANLSKDFKITVIHPESELAVINMAIGSSFSGAKSMVGTSGGGFALMNEGVSLAGICEAPVLIILSMRPGPATGVPTYTEQGDLRFALYAGHGEFPRIVASPGSLEEAYCLTAELLDLVWKFQTPGILLTEKHLSESSMTFNIDLEKARWAETEIYDGEEYKRYLDTENGISPLLFPPSNQLIKWNSYEHDELGFSTENPQMIALMHEKRYKKLNSLENYLKNSHTVNIFGNKGPLLFTYGSTTMSVLEAIEYADIDATIVQPIYLSPFPIWELEKFKDKSAIVIEMSKEGQFASLLREKSGVAMHYLINKYDGRPFDPIILSKKIKEVI